jgi:hypothetical protein
LDFTIGVAWVGLALTTAAIYKAKGRRFFTGLVWGALCAAFAVIYAVAMPVDSESLGKEAQARGTVKECPACAELVRAAANVCRYCGQEFLDGSGYET